MSCAHLVGSPHAVPYGGLPPPHKNTRLTLGRMLRKRVHASTPQHRELLQSTAPPSPKRARQALPARSQPSPQRPPPNPAPATAFPPAHRSGADFQLRPHIFFPPPAASAAAAGAAAAALGSLTGRRRCAQVARGGGGPEHTPLLRLHPRSAVEGISGAAVSPRAQAMRDCWALESPFLRIRIRCRSAAAALPSHTPRVRRARWPRGPVDSPTESF